MLWKSTITGWRDQKPPQALWSLPSSSPWDLKHFAKKKLMLSGRDCPFHPLRPFQGICLGSCDLKLWKQSPLEYSQDKLSYSMLSSNNASSGYISHSIYLTSDPCVFLCGIFVVMFPIKNTTHTHRKRQGHKGSSQEKSLSLPVHYASVIRDLYTYCRTKLLYYCIYYLDLQYVPFFAIGFPHLTDRLINFYCIQYMY